MTRDTGPIPHTCCVYAAGNYGNNNAAMLPVSPIIVTINSTRGTLQSEARVVQLIASSCHAATDCRDARMLSERGLTSLSAQSMYMDWAE